jgi:hypothetical protein
MKTDPRIPNGYGVLPALAARDERALRQIRDDDEFVRATAHLRARYKHMQRRSAVSAAAIREWLSTMVGELDKAEAPLAQLALLPVLSPPRVRGWLFRSAAARGWQRDHDGLDKDARQALETLNRWRTLFRDALNLAEAERPGRGRPATASARDVIAPGIEHLARAYRLTDAELATVRRVVFPGLAPATIAPPARIAKLRARASKKPAAG